MERIRHIISVTCDSACYDAELTLYMRDIVPLVEVSQSRHTIVNLPGRRVPGHYPPGKAIQPRYGFWIWDSTWPY